jgi:serine/threonine-protein kinase HipA
MRKAQVYRNSILVGEVIQHHAKKYEFIYDDEYYFTSYCPAISLTMPKTQKVYESDILFPCLFNLISEGVNRKLQCRQLQIDENDHFGILLATANNDTIGALTIKPIVTT